METKNLLKSLSLIMVILIAGCKKETFTETIGSCPIVISTNPIDGATNVPLNQIVTVYFNKGMNPETIKSASIYFEGDSTLNGSLTYSDSTARFTPSSPLKINTTYKGTVKTAVKDLKGNALQKDYVWTFSTGGTIAPIVISTNPANLDTGVALNKIITATFNMPMNPSTLNASTFTLYQGTTQIVGAVNFSGTTAFFDPTVDLKPNTQYVATISTGAKNPQNVGIGSNYVWTFKTGTLLLGPEVISTDPVNNDTGVALNKNITATFNMFMNPLTIHGTTFTLKRGATAIGGVVSYIGTTAMFNPTNDLLPSTTYTATITTGCQNLASTALTNDHVWTFKTPGLNVPEVILTDPFNLETSVVVNKTITAKFDMVMNASTLNGTTFTLKQGLTPIGGGVSYIGTIATFNPTNDLLPSTTYKATITTGAQNLAGTPLANDTVWTFTTMGPSGPPTVDLDCAADFAVLAGSAVTNTGGTVVDGDLGLSPGSSVTGFPPGVVINGSTLINTTKSNNAKLCLTTAFNDAAGRSLNVIIVSTGQLGGLTLAPGLYRSGISSFEITGSDLTLDAQGNANAVWIFQMPSSTLTVGNGIKVTLTNGASAKNIFWQVGSSATIGTTAAMKGNILADQSITLQTGATLLGRALTRIAAVTLDDNDVTKP